MGFQNIIDAQGIGLAVTGMAIVFVVLVLVSLFIAWLPRLLPVVNGILPPAAHHHGAPMPSAAPPGNVVSGPEEEIVAAIGIALHRRKGEG